MISLRDFYPANDEEDEEEEKAKIREIYQQNLEKTGVHMEIEPKEVFLIDFVFQGRI